MNNWYMQKCGWISQALCCVKGVKTQKHVYCMIQFIWKQDNAFMEIENRSVLHSLSGWGRGYNAK